MTKTEARDKALMIRDKISNINFRSNFIIQEILKSKILDKVKNIGIYYPIKNEIQILNIINYYPDSNFYLPKTKDKISFYPYHLNDELKKAKFNTFEPINIMEQNRDLIDAFIIPALAINKEKKRLGYGKGYYDKYLEGYKGIKIGIIYNELADLDFISNDFDVMFDYIFKG